MLGFCPLTYLILTPEKGEIIHFYAVNRWGDEDDFDEWTKPSTPMSPEIEKLLGATNEQLGDYRSGNAAVPSLSDFTMRQKSY